MISKAPRANPTRVRSRRLRVAMLAPLPARPQTELVLALRLGHRRGEFDALEPGRGLELLDELARPVRLPDDLHARERRDELPLLRHLGGEALDDLDLGIQPSDLLREALHIAVALIDLRAQEPHAEKQGEADHDRRVELAARGLVRSERARQEIDSRMGGAEGNGQGEERGAAPGFRHVVDNLLNLGRIRGLGDRHAEVEEGGGREEALGLVAGDPQGLAVTPLKEQKGALDFTDELLRRLRGHGSTGAHEPAAEEHQVGAPVMSMRPHGALGLDLAGQERAQVVAGDGYRPRTAPRLVDEPESLIERARLAGADEDPERDVGPSRIDAPVARHVLRGEGNVELELEADHLAETGGAADARHFQLLHHHEVPVEPHPKPAPLVTLTVELAGQLRARVVARVDRDAFEIATRGDHGQGQPTLVHQETRAGLHGSAGRQERMATRIPGGELPVGVPARRWTIATMRARGSPLTRPSASILNVALPTARPRPP